MKTILKNDWQDTCQGDNGFVAIDKNTEIGGYSTDGVNWRLIDLLPGNVKYSQRGWEKVCYGGGKYIAIADRGGVASISSDGINWKGFKLPLNKYWGKSFTYEDGGFILTAWNDTAVLYSIDGDNWFDVSVITENVEWAKLLIEISKLTFIEADRMLDRGTNPIVVSIVESIAYSAFWLLRNSSSQESGLSAPPTNLIGFTELIQALLSYVNNGILDISLLKNVDWGVDIKLVEVILLTILAGENLVTITADDDKWSNPIDIDESVIIEYAISDSGEVFTEIISLAETHLYNKAIKRYNGSIMINTSDCKLEDVFTRYIIPEAGDSRVIIKSKSILGFGASAISNPRFEFPYSPIIKHIKDNSVSDVIVNILEGSISDVSAIVIGNIHEYQKEYALDIKCKHSIIINKGVK